MGKNAEWGKHRARMPNGKNSRMGKTAEWGKHRARMPNGKNSKARPGFEPGMTVLQTVALANLAIGPERYLESRCIVAERKYQ